MDVVVYGVEEAPPGFRVVKSAKELRRHVGKAFLIVVGDKRLAEELGAAYFSGGIRLLKLAGVGAEVKKKGDRDVWYIRAYTDILAAGRKELRDALANIVKTALVKGWVDADKAESWLKKLERGLTLKED